MIIQVKRQKKKEEFKAFKDKKNEEAKNKASLSSINSIETRKYQHSLSLPAQSKTDKSSSNSIKVTPLLLTCEAF
jgi:hypothetical protein